LHLNDNQYANCQYMKLYRLIDFDLNIYGSKTIRIWSFDHFDDQKSL